MRFFKFVCDKKPEDTSFLRLLGIFLYPFATLTFSFPELLDDPYLKIL